MEILLWIIVALALAIGIARWDESNKTFWISFIAFMIGLVGCTTYLKMVRSTQSEQPCEQVEPIRGSTETPGHQYLLAGDLLTTSVCHEPNPVGQENQLVLSKVASTKKGHTYIWLQPPQIHKRLCTNSMTPHDQRSTVTNM